MEYIQVNLTGSRYFSQQKLFTGKNVMHVYIYSENKYVLPADSTENVQVHSLSTMAIMSETVDRYDGALLPESGISRTKSWKTVESSFVCLSYYCRLKYIETGKPDIEG